MKMNSAVDCQYASYEYTHLYSYSSSLVTYQWRVDGFLRAKILNCLRFSYAVSDFWIVL